jgi:uncharacterized cupin superfamily protein
MTVEQNAADHPCGASEVRWISEPGRLTQFGAFEEILQPGSRSSIKHWHAAEDELIYVLDGEVTVIEGGAATALSPGDSATFAAGTEVGHCLENRSTRACRYLVIGTRAEADVITYPDADKRCVRLRSLDHDLWIDSVGRPATSPCRR